MPRTREQGLTYVRLSSFSSSPSYSQSTSLELPFSNNTAFSRLHTRHTPTLTKKSSCIQTQKGYSQKQSQNLFLLLKKKGERQRERGYEPQAPSTYVKR